MKSPAKAKRVKAPVAKEAASQDFAEMIQARMLDEDKARLRDVKVDGTIVVYQFSNGYEVTADRKKIDAAGTDIRKYVTDCFLARKPT